MHLELASLSDDPVERAYHLALGTTEVNSSLAAEVEAAATLAAERTALVTAAGLARDALRLTPSEALEDRVHRAVMSGSWFMQCGEQAEAESVVTPVLDAVPVGPLRAQCLMARADALGQEVAEALPLLREASDQPGLDAETAVSTRMALARCLVVAGDLEESRSAARAAAAVASRAGMTGLVSAALLLEAETDLFLGVPLDLSDAWRRARDGSPGGMVYEHPDRLLAFSDSWRDDQVEAAKLLDGLLRTSGDRGDLASFGALSVHRAEVALRAGEIEQARVHADRSYRVAAGGVRDQMPLYIRAHVEAWRGQLDEALQLAKTGLAMADEAADALLGAQCLLVLGFTEVSAGRFDEAVRHEARLRDLTERMKWGHPGALRWQGDAVDAYLATGAVDDAADLTARLWGQADRMGLAGSRAVAARCEGLLHSHRGDLKLAEDSLLESLALMTGLDMPLERARTLLALGATRRRGRQKATARASLAEARDIFSRAGAAAWMGRVDAELQRAVGARAGQDLTVAERTVAELAAAGVTNREIGAKLYLSPKTVETVLTRVYRKLGVRSRTELARRLEAG
jgi:DNA-binding CsgD family transcriptional regulator